MTDSSTPTPTPIPDPEGPRSQEEELVHADDSIIGQAIKWSAVVVLVMLGLAALLVFGLRRKPPPLEPSITTLSIPQTPERPQAEAPVVIFTDITREAGITFMHHNGAYGDKLLPETMGGGCAFIDLDVDGDPDLLLVNSTDWPWRDTGDAARPTAALYLNDGTGRFTDATTGSGLDVPLYGMGVAVGDIDNDGLPDVYLTALHRNRLFHNLGQGRFKDITESAGVAGDEKEWSTGASFADLDNDGDLDLFVCNYVQWSREIDFEVGYSLTGIGRAYGPPMNFQGSHPRLYRNEGEGRFTDVSTRSGIQVNNPATGVPTAKSLAVTPVDLNRDGWMDVVVANDTVQNFVFENNRDGTFREVGGLKGIGFDSNGRARGAMGLDVAYFRNDDALGIGIANFANEMTALYVASPMDGMLFTDEAIGAGVGPQSLLLLKFGLFFFDYDLDGWQDLLTCNGHLEEEINQVQASQHYRQPAQLFWNAEGRFPGAGFVSVGEAQAGPDLFQPIVGRGSAFADLEGDGDLDVVFTQTGGPPLLLRNDQKLGHHWLRLKLVGRAANRDGIGAVVKVRVGNLTLTQRVAPVRSYLSHSEWPLTFGLGTADQVDDITILWPGNQSQKVDQVALDSLNIVEQK